MRGPCTIVLAAMLLATIPLRAGEIPQDQRRSGYSLMGPGSKAMQDDDTTDPGMLWVLDGEALWNQKLDASNKSCADCHGGTTAAS